MKRSIWLGFILILVWFPGLTFSGANDQELIQKTPDTKRIGGAGSISIEELPSKGTALLKGIRMRSICEDASLLLLADEAIWTKKNDRIDLKGISLTFKKGDDIDIRGKGREGYILLKDGVGEIHGEYHAEIASDRRLRGIDLKFDLKNLDIESDGDIFYSGRGIIFRGHGMEFNEREKSLRVFNIEEGEIRRGEFGIP